MDNLSYKQSYHYAMLLGLAQYKKLLYICAFFFWAHFIYIDANTIPPIKKNDGY